jgi:two-component system, response regulator
MMSREVDILLVEDNQADVTLTLRAISEGIMTDRVRVARDGEEALDFLFRRGSYSGHAGIPRLRLILLDLKLGKVSGLEVLAEVKNDPRSKIIPIVVLSSSKQESDVRRSYELGANSYMQKPVDFDEFCDLIRRVAGYWLQLNQAPFLPK